MGIKQTLGRWFGGGPSVRPSKGFGYKSSWLAIRGQDSQAVADALELGKQRPVSWGDGLEKTQGLETYAVFVTPPVDGWVLAVLSSSVIEAIDLAALSRRFGEAQKFGTHRGVGFHTWERYVDGAPVRRYSVGAEGYSVDFDRGTPDPAEGKTPRAADLERAAAEELEEPDFYVGEETVIDVARAWSVDPTALDERDDLPEQGILGDMFAERA